MITREQLIELSRVNKILGARLRDPLNPSDPVNWLALPEQLHREEMMTQLARDAYSRQSGLYTLGL